MNASSNPSLDCCREYENASRLSRRRFLKGMAATSAAAVSTTMFGDALRQTSFGATTGGNVMVVISLRGGIDGLGMVVPHGDPGYYRARPRLALPKGAKIGIPNDPSNGGRALNLLAAQGIIKLKAGQGLSPSLLDIAENPKGIKFSELDAAQLPRALPDLDAAVINTDHALNGGLDIRKDTIAVEKREGNPYANFVAARQGEENRPEIKTFVESYQSPEVAKFLEERFKGAIIPAW